MHINMVAVLSIALKMVYGFKDKSISLMQVKSSVRSEILDRLKPQLTELEDYFDQNEDSDNESIELLS